MSDSTAMLKLTTPGSISTPSVVVRSGERPAVVLHTRVVAGAGGGPDKTILRSARYADPRSLHIAAAYIHPHNDPGIAVLRDHAQRLGCPLWEIGEAGPLDHRTVRTMLHLCKKLKVTVWHGHDYKSNAMGLLLKRFWSMKLVTTVHGWTWDTPRTRFYYQVDNWCLPHYDQVIAVSPQLHQHCRELGIADDRLSYIPNAIDTDEFHPTRTATEARRELGIKTNRLIIGCVGRLSSEKGYDRALKVFAQLKTKYPKAELHLVGDGPERGHLGHICHALKITGSVKFWGWQKQSQKFYEAMDLFLLPSHTEGFPNVVLEAMAMGVPVAATNTGGVAELLDHGRAGVILDQNEATWASHIEPLLVSDVRREEIARRGRARIDQFYTFDRRMSRVFDVYARVLPYHPKLREAAQRQAA